MWKTQTWDKVKDTYDLYKKLKEKKRLVHRKGEIDEVIWSIGLKCNEKSKNVIVALIDWPMINS